MSTSELSLRRLWPADAKVFAEWGHDEAFRRASGWSVSVRDSHLLHWRRLIDDCGPELLRRAIVRDQEILGYVDLYGTDPQSREFGIAIGPSKNWGAGLGREAARLTIALCFGELGLREITAETHQTNLRAQRLLTAVGFSETGRQGSEMYDGETVGLIQYELSRDSWRPYGSPKDPKAVVREELGTRLGGSR